MKIENNIEPYGTKNELILPFDKLIVAINDINSSFEVKENTYNTYFSENDVELHPEGCLLIEIPPTYYKPGDIVTVCLKNTKIQCDGGDEHTMNMVGQNEIILSDLA